MQNGGSQYRYWYLRNEDESELPLEGTYMASLDYRQVLNEFKEEQRMEGLSLG